MPLQKKKLDGCKSGQTRNMATTRIEIWRYNPCFFSKNGIVDKLSLFLAMKDMDDERIQIELETMINNMIW